jgi:hypothetical protein
MLPTMKRMWPREVPWLERAISEPARHGGQPVLRGPQKRRQLKRTFPGFQQCMKMMRQHDPEIKEEGYHCLLPFAHEHVPELTAAFQAETKHGLRCWLFELLGEARSPDLLPLFAEALRGEDDSLWWRALYALKLLDTKDARRLIYDAQFYTFSTEEQTRLFRSEYERAKGSH